MTRTVLITGCSSGFGRLTARTFQDAGWNVVTTMRAPERVPELVDHDRMLVLKLDVTDPGSISAAFAAARARFGRIRCRREQRRLRRRRPVRAGQRRGYPCDVRDQRVRPDERHARGAARDEGGGEWCHRQRDLDGRSPGPAGTRCLLRLEARHDRPDREHGAGIQALGRAHPFGRAGRLSDHRVRRQYRRSAGGGRRPARRVLQSACGRR